MFYQHHLISKQWSLLTLFDCFTGLLDIDTFVSLLRPTAVSCRAIALGVEVIIRGASFRRAVFLPALLYLS